MTVNILVVVLSHMLHGFLWEEIKDKTENLLIFTGSDANVNYYDEKNKIVFFDCNDKYDGIPEKVVLIIDFILKNPKFDKFTHIIKIDDHDNIFTDENIKNLHNLEELSQYDYIGQKVNINGENEFSDWHFNRFCKNDYWINKHADVSNITWCDGGCSYILSREAMRIINKVYNSNNIDELRKTEIYEDCMIGKILNKNNIYPYKINYGICGDKNL